MNGVSSRNALLNAAAAAAAAELMQALNRWTDRQIDTLFFCKSGGFCLTTALAFVSQIELNVSLYLYLSISGRELNYTNHTKIYKI